MTPEQSLILSVLRCQLQNTPSQALPDFSEINWSSMIQEIHIHAVSLLFFTGLTRLQLPVPPKFYEQCSVLARRTTARNLRNEHLQRHLVCQLEQKQYPYVILKGEAAAAYYPEPETRQLGDIDFMLPSQHADDMIDVFKQQGFEHSCAEDPYHQILKNGSRWMELHFEPAGIPEGSSGQPIRDFLHSIYEEKQVFSDALGSFCAPGSAHHGLILLLHMQHHMTSLGMGLRHLIDWACFVQKTWDHPFWEDRLIPLLKQIGLFHYAAVLTKLCAIHLQSPCPAWACYPEEDLCHAVLEDILSCGSFGMKDKYRARSSNMLPDHTNTQMHRGKLASLYNTLQKSVIKYHPEIANKPFLLFLAMTRKVFRYLILLCFGKRPNLFKVANLADAREAVYHQLKIFQSEQ